MSALPSFDRSAIEAHVSLLHDPAEGIDGILILAAFEPGAQAHVQRFRIGDVDGMVGTIMGFENHPNLNLYAPWSVFRRDLEPGKKGSEADVVAVLAAVGDLDNDKYALGKLPVEAPYIVETSPGNFQPVYIFERPLAAADAKPVLAALCAFAGGDSATKDTSHVWRIPGCLNWPTKSKLARGRPPVPVLATIKKGYDGSFTNPAALLALAPPKPPPNGYDTAPPASLSPAEEARLRGALEVIPADDYDIWLHAGMALHEAGARDLWDAWSQRSDKFDQKRQDLAWDSFKADRNGKKVTIATIYGWAKERGWTPRLEVNHEAFYRNRPQSREQGPLPPPPSRVIGAGTFLRSYVPISYTIDGILPSGSLYGVTAKPGTGKTAWMIAATLAVETGRKDILGCEVEPGRVAYVTIENPIDFKMKLAANCYVHNISFDEFEPRVAIIDGRDTPEQIYEGLKLDATANGQFELICLDTFQAGFAAANAGAFNDNEAVLKYVTRLRLMIVLPGSPSVLVAFHPTKNAGEGELIPYGGGAILNEIDGNLTLWKEASIKLYHNRLRGPEFEPTFFRIEKLSCPDIVDKQGRQILLPVMRPIAEADAEVREKSNVDTARALLKSMIDEPAGTQAEWGIATGQSKGRVNGHLQKLEKERLVIKRLNKWSITKKRN